MDLLFDEKKNPSTKVLALEGSKNLEEVIK